MPVYARLQSSTDDIENQKAMSLAKQVDPSGLRTIGVLTKPDTLTAGATRSKELWLDILEGRDLKHPLKLGYYCTRQPDDDERARGISGTDARAAEAAFFNNTAPWSTSGHQHRFGTTNLVSSISKLLTQIIRESYVLSTSLAVPRVTHAYGIRHVAFLRS